MDTKKLGRIVRPSHRVTADRRDSVDGAGWEFAHVAIDDHSRASFVQMRSDERKESVVEFLRATVAHYKALGVTVKRLLTDNGSALQAVRQDLPGARHQAHLHQTVPATNQWQGRTVHPDLPSRVGLRLHVEQQCRANGMVARVSGVLQRPQAPLGSW
jgi:hypothetical protein